MLPGGRGSNGLRILQYTGRRDVLVDGSLLGLVSLRPLVAISGRTVEIIGCILPVSHVHRLDILSLAGRDLRGVLEVELVIAKSCPTMVRSPRPPKWRLANCDRRPLASLPDSDHLVRRVFTIRWQFVDWPKLLLLSASTCALVYLLEVQLELLLDILSLRRPLILDH